MKKDLFLCALSGLLIALSFPLAIFSGDIFAGLPNGLIIFFAFVPFFKAMENTRGRAAFIKGFVTGFVWQLIGELWIVVALNIYGGIPLAGGLAIVLVIVIVLALHMGLFSWLLSITSGRFPLILSAPPLFLTVELIRTYIGTGYPWLMPSYALADFTALIQVLDLTGVFGLLLLIMIINITAYEIVRFFLKQRSFPIPHTAVSVILLALCLIYGVLRINQIDGKEVLKNETVALIQGNIKQDQKWDDNYSGGITGKYAALSLEAEKAGPSLVIWPEGALPYSMNVNKENVPLFKSASFNADYLIGVITYERLKGKKSRSYNSAFYISPGGKIKGMYHKTHLVPFSENVLLDDYIPFIRKLVPPVAGDFTPADQIKVFDHDGSKFGVLICFEAIFGMLSRRFINDGAQFLVNITNDAWFGDTSGPYQHFDMAKFRAIEGRVYLVRAANTGISAIIDSAGKVIKKTELFKDAIVIGNLKIKKIGSLYMMTGDLLAYISVFLSILMLSFCLKKIP